MIAVESPLSPETEAIVSSCIGVAIDVHRELGAGFKELIYQRAYCLELDSRGISFESEKPVLVTYRHWQIPGQRLDLVVAGEVLVEIKAVPRIKDAHHAQVRSYLKATGLRIGLLFNFNERLVKNGMRRIVV